MLTFAVSKTKRIFSSVGLEHYLDRVGVGGSSPYETTLGAYYAPFFYALKLPQSLINQQLTATYGENSHSFEVE